MISPILTNYIIVAIENTPEKQEPLPLHSIKTPFYLIKLRIKAKTCYLTYFFIWLLGKKVGYLHCYPENNLFTLTTELIPIEN